MKSFEALIAKLKQHHELSWSEVPGGLRIEPPTSNGFAVEIHAEIAEWTTYLGDAGFHETFDTEDETLQFVAWCYSGEARLRECWRGNTPSWSVLETWESGEWCTESQTRFIFVPFWRKRRQIILQNPNLLKAIKDSS